jgi:hypothetical protein
MQIGGGGGQGVLCHDCSGMEFDCDAELGVRPVFAISDITHWLHTQCSLLGRCWLCCYLVRYCSSSAM